MTPLQMSAGMRHHALLPQPTKKRVRFGRTADLNPLDETCLPGKACDRYQVTNLEGILISLQPLLLDLVADVARILM